MVQHPEKPREHTTREPKLRLRPAAAGPTSIPASAPATTHD